MTRTAVAICHVHFEDLGTLEPLLRERGYTIRYVDAAVGDLHAMDALAPDLLVVLGGPIGAFDDDTYPFITDELALIRRRVAVRAPTLGICLGAQLIARALGANVYPLGVKEIGFGPLQLTDDGQQSVLAQLGDTPVLHWHGDQFDIPPGAMRLASTVIGANQAFSLGATVLGLQFHLEADTRNLESWLVGHACELGQAGIDPRSLRSEARQVQESLAAASCAVFKAWLDGFENHEIESTC